MKPMAVESVHLKAFADRVESSVKTEGGREVHFAPHPAQEAANRTSVKFYY